MTETRPPHTETPADDNPAAPDPADLPPGLPAPRACTLPVFTPVPRAAERSNGWKPEVQRAFIEALAETGSVRAACRAVHRADHGAYLLRRHPEAGEFRKAWDAALDIAMRRIEDIAMDRALHGHEQPVYSYGKLVGTRTVHNDRLLMFMLRNRAPDRFQGGLRQTAKGPNAIDTMELNRLRKQWRKDWEKEHAERSAARPQQSGDAFIQSVEARHVRWWAHLGPRARAAYLEFRRIESEEARVARYGEDQVEGRWDEAQTDAALDDYDETFGDDDRAPIDRLIEADGLADAAVLGEDCPAPPPGRMISLTDNGWLGPANRIPDDGRATEWP